MLDRLLADGYGYGCTLRRYWDSEKGGRDLRDYLRAWVLMVLVMLLVWQLLK
ncbi:MAG TPA: hypothetical protein VN611_16930 [Patescibacteria group bacterium]|nr:hypothetical protein [Patescibacteria group bacterium]